MKLCYIWVEDYKGFENQGFNFSTEFIFNFSYQQNKITKIKNEKFINNFFGDGIIEITAVIGRNASGKTNILELVQYVVDGANTIINRPFLAIFEFKGKFIIHHFRLPGINFSFKGELKTYEGQIKDLNSIFFSNVFDGRRHNFNKDIINISTNDLLNSQFGENINKNYQKTIQQQIKFIKSRQFDLLEAIEKGINQSNTYKLKPSKVILTSPVWSNIMTRVKGLEQKIWREFEIEISLKEFVLNFKRKITDNQSANSIKYLTALIVFLDFTLNRDIHKYYENKIFPNRKDYINALKSLFEVTILDLRIGEIFEHLTQITSKDIDRYWGAFETSKFLTELNYFEFDVKDREFKENLGTYTNRRIQFILDYNDKVGSFLMAYLDAITNQSLSYGIEWSGISSGHKAYLNLFSNFYSTLSRITEEHILICVDEGDLYFHPKWQTEFLYKLIKILPKLLGKPCQLILTTHSPFLVSDLPKNNLLFVEKKGAQLIVIPNENVEGETFGGNIGELYLDTFFMDGNLISHFAASKIQTLIDKIKTHKGITNDDRILIEGIGEDLIKLQLKKLLGDKN